jgi:MoxR-like ATPase
MTTTNDPTVEPAAVHATGSGPAMSLAEVQQRARGILEAVATVIDGKDGAISTALTVLLAEGHLLIEDVPGVGKTQLARALAKAVDATVTRIQFTPDLLPSDITGVSVYDRQSSSPVPSSPTSSSATRSTAPRRRRSRRCSRASRSAR